MRSNWVIAMGMGFWLAVGLPACESDDDTDSPGSSTQEDTIQSETDTSETDPGDTATGDTATGDEELVWADLDFQGRQAFMATTVLPEMQALFSDFDEEYADDFNCGTCHGSDLETFAMPSDIPPLSAEELSTFTFAGEGRQETAGFMATQVVPQMAALLDQEPFDPATNTGTFGCGSCHGIE